MDPCVSCKEEVEDGQPALRCDICNLWEHVGCIRQAERPSDALYRAMTECNTHSLLYVCSCCHRQGPVPKRLLQLDLERTRANDERLASARQLEERDATIAELRAQMTQLVAREGSLQDEVLRLSRQLTHVSVASNTSATVETDPPPETSEPLLEDDESSSSEDSSVTSRESRRRAKRVDPYPPGFKALIDRVGKFSGAKGIAGDFEAWLEDFVEATGDCNWDDGSRAKWFSWFLTGPAKASWQHTLKTEDKSQWERIKEVFKGEYGIHLDPRTAYQRCHELRYEQFGSAQSLLTAMREYQRIAPHKLTDVCLESILWNKVPIELQKEVKEITTDGSVQELLQKLMQAEAVVQERKRRDELVTQVQTGHGRTTRLGRKPDSQPADPVPRSRNTDMGSTKPPNDSNVEMSLKAVKCFNCKKKGHLARSCPEPRRKDATRRINASETQEEKDSQNPWIRTVRESRPEPLAMRGPTYKVPVVVNGVKTRALLDHGAQVSLVRKELLSVIKEGNQWSASQCEARNLRMDGQPVGAGGEALGAVAVVALDVAVEKTEETQQVPCYALESSKPIWKGELENCALILGTNALGRLGFNIVYSDGTTVEPEGPGDNTVAQPQTTKVLAISLRHAARIGPQQTVMAGVRVDHNSAVEVSNLAGIVVPKEEVLAQNQCDFAEGLWCGQSEFEIPVTNWGTQPLTLDQGSVVGHIEEAVIIGENDELWKEEWEPTVRAMALSEAKSRLEKLTSQLTFGNKCSKEEQGSLEKLLHSKHQVFALEDCELGEVDLVEHKIEMTEHKPF